MAQSDEDFEEGLPPRQRKRQKDDYDDHSGDEDRLRPHRRELSWLDKQFANTSMIILVLFPVCCGMIAVIFGIIGVAACQDPKARRNAIMVLVISVTWIVVAIGINVVMVLFGKTD